MVETGTTYETFLRALLQALRASGLADPAPVYEEFVHRLAAQHSEIPALPDPRARLEAARRVLFGGGESSEVEPTDRGFAISLFACPVAVEGMEVCDLCAATRALLSRLTGLEVEQSEWIIRGDPRCTFELTVPGRPGPAAWS